ncbi:MAG: hypothetical protein SAK29_33570 [Scytonema sp. PMC 1069.18]|nr:hypothetical protein [Scytonema sp. PMC 1069.18]MEC4887812.1 hypothetical protein [Scytonema sp. PMC 1070.18]
MSFEATDTDVTTIPRLPTRQLRSPLITDAGDRSPTRQSLTTTPHIFDCDVIRASTSISFGTKIQLKCSVLHRLDGQPLPYLTDKSWVVALKCFLKQ